MNDGIDRRSLLGLMGAGAVAMSAAAAAAMQEGRTQPGGPTLKDGAAPMNSGWDAAKKEFVLPPLPYPAEALEPAIDAQTMSIHHDKHHAGYVRGLNTALKELEKIRSGEGDEKLTKHWMRELAFNGSGHANHTLFWQVMAPPDAGGGGTPKDQPLAQAIERDFGSFDSFAGQFKAAAGSVEGSGWGMLVYHPMSDKLLVMQAEKHQNLTIWGVIPLMGVDVWEHAYYLKYQNNRGKYVDAFMTVVNWGRVAELFAAAKSANGGGSSQKDR